MCMASIGIFAAVLTLFIVQKSSPPTGEIMMRYEQLRHELDEIIQTRGPRAALDYLKSIASSDKDLAGLCHDLSHDVGHAAQESLGFSGALAIQDDVCGSGYVHGVIEEELLHHSDDFENRFRTLCSADDPRCFHGLGHGLMYVTDNNLPESLRNCRAFTVPFQRIQCDEGVFMENFSVDSVVHPSLYLYPDDPYRTCRDQPEPERGVCSFYFPRYFLRVHPAAYADLFSFCQTLPKDSVEACIKGGGSAAMKSLILEPEKVLDVCESISPHQQHLCIKGLLSYLIVHYASTVPAEKFCDESLEPAWSDICAKSLSEGRDAYGSD